MTSHPFRIGLTGGMGSGKSTVAALLAHAGALVIDADAIARAVTAPGGLAIAPLRAAFGPQCITKAGALDRAAMRALVFDNPAARTRLEGIIHPLVQQEAASRIAEAGRSNQRWVVLDIPLLVEHLDHWREQIDHVLVVDCDPDTQVARVTARDHLPESQIRKILEAQATRAQRLSVADTIIDNGKDVDNDQLQARVQAFVQRVARYHAYRPL